MKLYTLFDDSKLSFSLYKEGQLVGAVRPIVLSSNTWPITCLLNIVWLQDSSLVKTELNYVDIKELKQAMKLKHIKVKKANQAALNIIALSRS